MEQFKKNLQYRVANMLKLPFPYKTVLSTEYGISALLPLVSVGYWSCRAVIISNGRKVGLSHILPPDDPLFYIDKMIKDLKATPKSLKALIMETDKENYEYDIGECCNKEGIMQVDYCRVPTIKDTKHDVCPTKDIIVYPLFQKVLIHIREVYQIRVLNLNKIH